MTDWEEMWGRRPRVLLADDDVVSRKVGERLLLRLGVDCVVVEDGQAAVEAVAGGGFDLVLMDCEMPVLDGMAATRAIRAAEVEGRLPVVAVSSHSTEEWRSTCLDAGMDALVPKALTKATLGALLDRWLPGGGEAGTATEAAAPAPAPAPVAAPSRPKGLLSLMELEAETGREGFARMVIDRYLPKAEAALQSLRESLASGDADTVRRAAHTLKGSSGTVGADAVGALAKELEQRSENAEASELAALLPLVEGMAVALAAYRDEVADV